MCRRPWGNTWKSREGKVPKDFTCTVKRFIQATGKPPQTQGAQEIHLHTPFLGKPFNNNIGSVWILLNMDLIPQVLGYGSRRKWECPEQRRQRTMWEQHHDGQKSGAGWETRPRGLLFWFSQQEERDLHQTSQASQCWCLLEESESTWPSCFVFAENWGSISWLS